MKRIFVAVIGVALLGGCTPHSVAVNSASAPVAVAAPEQPPRLATAPNFRDIGGYRTADGHVVRRGLAYRSDQLDRLSDADLAAIGQLGPSAIVDLRTVTERAREPDRVPAGVRHEVLDVAADSKGSLGGDMRLAMAQIARGEGGALLVAANREFVTLPSARRSYAALIRLMLAPGGPVVFHCTAGKDRTGWGTAVVLSLLGVPRETVMADYMLSNTMLAEKNNAMLAGLERSGMRLNPAFLKAALTVDPSYIGAAFDEVERTYGSMDMYARKGLGLSAGELRQLRARFLAAGNRAS